jgi:hypothetical protein
VATRTWRTCQGVEINDENQKEKDGTFMPDENDESRFQMSYGPEGDEAVSYSCPDNWGSAFGQTTIIRYNMLHILIRACRNSFDGVMGPKVPSSHLVRSAMQLYLQVRRPGTPQLGKQSRWPACKLNLARQVVFLST